MWLSDTLSVRGLSVKRNIGKSMVVQTAMLFLFIRNSHYFKRKKSKTMI